MPPLPDSMRYPESGWWWFHIFCASVVFCWGWYHGQNRATRKLADKLKAEKKETDR